MTQDQVNSLKSWADERDEILRSISIAKDTLNNLNKQITSGSISLTDLLKRIAFAEGTLHGLKTKEENDRMHRQQLMKEHSIDMTNIKLKSLIEKVDLVKEHLTILEPVRDAIKNMAENIPEDSIINNK